MFKKKGMSIKTAKMVQDKIVKNDVDWIAVDAFRIWSLEEYTEPDGVMGMQLKCHTYQIEEID